jgi:hypothetical protein
MKVSVCMIQRMRIYKGSEDSYVVVQDLSVVKTAFFSK